MPKNLMKFLTSILLLLSASTLMFCSSNQQATSRRNVIFITLDTTRADHIGIYGNTIIQTPALDALASDSVVFNHCYSTTHSTIPAHTSMFTSLYLKDHGVISNGGLVLPNFKEFMPKVFKNAGYKTAAFTSGGHLTPLTNISQGFDDFYYPEGNEIIAEVNNKKIFHWLDQNKNNPFFIWAHFFDAHRDYHPPAPYDKMYTLKSDQNFTDLEIKNKKTNIGTPKYFKQSQDPEFYRNLYKGEISYLDNQIGQLINKLKELGLYDNSIIVLVADHGEYMGEHTLYFDHRGGIFDEVVHVPLFIKTERAQQTGFRNQLVSIIDIFPTLMELLSLNLTDPIRGISLVEILKDRKNKLPRDKVFFESSWRRYAGVKTQKYTFIREFFRKINKAKSYEFNNPMEIGFIGNPVGHQMLFDNNTDKDQANNLATVAPELANKFEQDLIKFSSDILKVSQGVSITKDKKYLEKLKALGYLK